MHLLAVSIFLYLPLHLRWLFLFTEHLASWIYEAFPPCRLLAVVLVSSGSSLILWTVEPFLGRRQVLCARSPDPCRALQTSANHSCNHEGCGNAAIGLFLAHVSTAWPPPSICLTRIANDIPCMKHHERSSGFFIFASFLKVGEFFLAAGVFFPIHGYTGGHKLLTPWRSSARCCK